MQIRLISLDYQAPQLEMDLDGIAIVIGHATDVEIRLQDPTVSEHHCRIERLGGSLRVCDLGSVHGTYVNGSRVTEARCCGPAMSFSSAA